MRFSRILFLCALTAAFAGCSTSNSQRWISPLHQEHPLVGKIWSAVAQEFVTQTQLLAAAQNADFLLLGEKHDNPDHHQLQRSVLASLNETGQLNAVSLEMMDSTQQALLQDQTALSSLSSAQLKSALSWDESGWNWEFYGPLAQSVLGWGVTLRAANIDSAAVGTMYAMESAPELEGYLSAEQLSVLTRQVDESHCGMLPESQFPAMVRVQQARDLSMARAVSAGDKIQVLVAGNFHVRRDLGVPNYIDESVRGLLSVAFIEVSPESILPQDYLEQFSSQLPYDYIWFTPAVQVEDYCASLRASR